MDTCTRGAGSRRPRAGRPGRLSALPLALLIVAASALSSPAQVTEERMTELERRIEILTQEIERLRAGEELFEAPQARRYGLGPAASKIYRTAHGVSLAGYGEMLYENFSGEDESGTASGALDRADFLRAILYVGNRFSDRLLFNSEIEIEHASEAFVEFAYLDYMLSGSVGVRAGLLLAPLGLVNELHEPPVFVGATRPLTENRIIPTTWRENGIGLFGTTPMFSWRLYVMNGLEGSGFTAGGLRGGRQKGIQALAEDLGVAVRLDWDAVPGLIAGVSAYSGGSGQGIETTGGASIKATTTILDAHLDYTVRALRVRGLFASATIGDSELLNDFGSLTGSDSVGSTLRGWYLEALYDLLAGRATDSAAGPYLRYESLDTQAEVPAGFTADPANEITATTLGVYSKPVLSVVVKTEYMLMSNAAGTGVNRLNVQLGYLF